MRYNLRELIIVEQSLKHGFICHSHPERGVVNNTFILSVAKDPGKDFMVSATLSNARVTVN